MSDLDVLEGKLDRLLVDINALVARQEATEKRAIATDKRVELNEDSIARLNIVVFGDPRYNVPGIMAELATISQQQREMIKARDAQVAQWTGAQTAAKILVALLGANLLTALPDLLSFLAAMFK